MIFESLFDFYYVYKGQIPQKTRVVIHSNNLTFSYSHSISSIIIKSSKISENIKSFIRIKIFVRTIRRILWVKTIQTCI